MTDQLGKATTSEAATLADVTTAPVAATQAATVPINPEPTSLTSDGGLENVRPEHATPRSTAKAPERPKYQPTGGGPFGPKAVERSISFWPSMRRLLGHLAPERMILLLVIALAVVGIVLSVVGPKLLGWATDIIFTGILGKQLPSGASKDQVVAQLRASGQDTYAELVQRLDVIPGVGIDFTRLSHILLLALSLYLLSSLFLWLQGYLLNGAVQRSVLTLRNQVESKLNRLPLSYFDRQTRGELLSRVTNDIDNIAQALQQTLSQLLTSLLTVLGVTVMMLVVSPILAIVALVTIPVSMVITALIAKRSQGMFTAQWKSTGELNSHIEEAFTGHSLVKVFGRRHEVEAVFAERNGQLFHASFGAQFVSGIIMPAMMFIGNLNYVVIAVLGGLRVASGTMNLGDVQAFIQYSRMFTQPLTQVASMANLLQSGVASAERVFEVLDGEEQSAEANGALRPPRGRVEFEHVAFSYGAPISKGVDPLEPPRKGVDPLEPPRKGVDPLEPPRKGGDPHEPAQAKRPLITDLSLVADPGHTVAIVGPTGAGKTTLVNLIMRFYELDAGRITLDGVDIASVPRSALRSTMGMVLQDTWLFHGTIRENIAYGRPAATEAEIMAAAEAAYVDRFVHSLPDGFDTLIDEEASNISAGEKQLLTIARAFLADPALLILDEATSSVDTRTEVLVQRAMAALRSTRAGESDAGRTSFVIAHRLSTIRDADVILVMEDGQIVEQGNHHDLLAARGPYFDLYNSQFAGTPEAEGADESPRCDRDQVSVGRGT